MSLSKWTVLPALFAVISLAACTSSSSEEEDVSEGAENAFTEGQLRDLESQEAALKQLRQVAAADTEQFEISVKDIAVPEKDATSGVSLENGYATYGLDWFKSPRASYPDNKRWEQGSDIGKKCQWASLFRFEAIFKNPPAEAEELRGASSWGGRFWQWIDDYAGGNRSVQDPQACYAYSSGLYKWIGSSGKGDVCRLPTRAMVVGMMKDCKAHAARNGGNTKDCEMRSYADSQEFRQPSQPTQPTQPTQPGGQQE